MRILTKYDIIKNKLLKKPSTWLITGVAGFIGSNILETLLELNQRVVGLDNFSTGYQQNLDEVKRLVTTDQWKNFYLIKGDIRNEEDCRKAMKWKIGKKRTADVSCSETFYVNFVLHQAAIGSVPRSIKDPVSTNQSNVEGFLNILIAARDAKVAKLVYASSSAVYGDQLDLPKIEEKIGNPLSPYAITKITNELYGKVFAKNYFLDCIGLRYFNVFGRRQDPNSSYSAVIPIWAKAMIENEPVFIFGDGKNSRDFCHVDNVVQANILSATIKKSSSFNQVYNVAVGNQTSLNELFELIKSALAQNKIIYNRSPFYKKSRLGDIRHSLADIDKAKNMLGYLPSRKIGDGLNDAIIWYIKRLSLQ